MNFEVYAEKRIAEREAEVAKTAGEEFAGPVLDLDKEVDAVIRTTLETNRSVPKVRKFVIMRRDVHPDSGETLAEYYHRTYRHLLRDVMILELDTTTMRVRQLGM